MRTLLTTLHSKYIHPSLALPCLAAYCGADCGELRIREYTLHQPKENLLGRILGEKPDVVCFSVYIWNRQLTLELVAALKQARPQLKLVLGGPEISFEEATFFFDHPVDALICGEGEIPLRRLLAAWQRGEEPAPCAGLQLPGMSYRETGQAQLDKLDELPSPFAAGLVDLSRGYVYYESSRGCPFSCSFCMSALDERVRSFSMARIRADLGLLMAQRVAQIKFVDRTFNYHAARSREIIAFILEHNLCSRFHFEIGAELLDEETLALLERVPPGTFQFEIGVQTLHPHTLERISRRSLPQLLLERIEQLQCAGNIDLHLDLIAGLPGESQADFLASLDRLLALGTDHLQVELVKLLPGSPLRAQAAELGISFDPSPPYTVLKTRDLGFSALEQLRGIGRLIDLLANSRRFVHFLGAAAQKAQGRAGFYLELEGWWRQRGLFDEPLGQAALFTALLEYCATDAELREELARDFALAGRVVPGQGAGFFPEVLTATEQDKVKRRLKQELAELPAGDKLQHFAAVYLHQPPGERRLALYLYRSRSGERPLSEEIFL